MQEEVGPVNRMSVKIPIKQACVCSREALTCIVLLDGEVTRNCIFADAEAGVVVVREILYPDTSEAGKYPSVGEMKVIAKVGKVEIRQAW